MKIVVIGCTGLIGSKLIALLTAQGHTAVASAPTQPRSEGKNVLIEDSERIGRKYRGRKIARST